MISRHRAVARIFFIPVMPGNPLAHVSPIVCFLTLFDDAIHQLQQPPVLDGAPGVIVAWVETAVVGQGEELLGDGVKQRAGIAAWGL